MLFAKPFLLFWLVVDYLYSIVVIGVTGRKSMDKKVDWPSYIIFKLKGGSDLM